MLILELFSRRAVETATNSRINEGTGVGRSRDCGQSCCLRESSAMRYEVLIDIVYLQDQGGLSEGARRSLSISMRSQFSDVNTTVDAFEIVAGVDGRLRVRVAIAGATASDLTSPIVAGARVDAALNHALIQTGLFEEFDVSRRSITIRAR